MLVILASAMFLGIGQARSDAGVVERNYQALLAFNGPRLILSIPPLHLPQKIPFKNITVPAARETTPQGVIPGQTYNFATLRYTLEKSGQSFDDANDVFRMIPKAVLDKLDRMESAIEAQPPDGWNAASSDAAGRFLGASIIYHPSFFEKPQPGKKCSPAGTYSPWNRQINIYCKRPVSILLAEGAHAVDQLLGNGRFKSQVDPEFKRFHEKYQAKTLAYVRSRGHKDLKDYLEKEHTPPWDYLPGANDANPILGPQGYDQIVELYMEGFIYYYYNSKKLQMYHPDLAAYISASIEQAQRMDTEPALSVLRAQSYGPGTIIVDPL